MDQSKRADVLMGVNKPVIGRWRVGAGDTRKGAETETRTHGRTNYCEWPPPPAPFEAASSAWRRLWISCRRLDICRAFTSRFTTGLLRMFRTRFAYRSVVSVSSKFTSAGDTHATMIVRELPPSESCV